MILYGVGAGLGLLTAALFRLGGPRRELWLFAHGLVVAALIYVGFAAFGGAGGRWVLIELAGLGLFGSFAVLGARAGRGWPVALGWALHVFWDVALHGHGTPFVPSWYPPACLGFDLAMAVWIGWRFRPNTPPR